MQPTRLSISKHYILSIFSLILLFQFEAHSQTTIITDSNFEEVLVNMNIDTNGLNGNILNSDASNVCYLYIDNQNIHDLSGIEAFTNLKTLDCSYNNLSSLDISQNLHLEELNADDNQISSINLAQNSKLKEISLSANQLVSIDVSNLFSLKELSISLNSLTDIDVSANLNLEFLGCYSNAIEDLNILNNTKLKYLFIDDTGITDLNLSQNPKLKTLSCASNNLNELLVQSNSDLEYLDCRSNNITNLDISSNIQLKRLFVSNNNLNEINILNAPNLLLLYAGFNNFTSLDISANSVLRWVKCEGNNLSTVDFRNGNNGNISQFEMTQNSNLSCIFVDDPQASYLLNWLIDDTSAFVQNESDCEALSVEEASLFTFNIYPNPASENVTISIATQEAKLELYSIKGQLIYSNILTYGTNNVSLDRFSSGMYIVKITSENISETKKLLLK